MKRARAFGFWIALLAIFFISLHLVSKPIPTVSFKSFVQDLKNNSVDSVHVDGNRITVNLFGRKKAYSTLGTIDAKLQDEMNENGVLVETGPPRDPFNEWLTILAPIFIVAVLIIFFLKRMGGANNKMVQLTKSRARLVEATTATTFDDVGGCDEAKAVLRDLVDFLKEPKKWSQVGARLPRGILLEGPPGCGKTLLARAVAGETKAKFYVVSGSEFVELFVGVGAARVRDMFDTAKKNAPAVIFIDELDAVGRSRGSGMGFANDERESTLNQILVCMDGFTQNERVVVIGATNRADVLDRALIRPGRFEALISVPELDRNARLQALKIHTKNKKLASEVSLDELADNTESFNGAQLESLTNHGALLAVRRGNANGNIEISSADLLAAKKIVLSRPSLLSGIDSILIESTSQLTQPQGKATVRISLEGGLTVTGDVIWANAAFIKIKSSQDKSEIAIAKNQICRLEPILEGMQGS